MAQDDYWTTNLLDARLEAGANSELDLTFPITDRNVNGGRAWAARKYPFRNGQSDEDTGANPRGLSYVVPLFREVENEHYPNLFNDLIEAFESDEWKGRATLTDPEFGPISVRMVGYEWGTTGKTRNGGSLKLTFETLGDDLITLLTIQGQAGAPAGDDTVEQARAVDSSLADAGQTPTDSATRMRDSGVPIEETERLELGLSASFSANVGLAVGVSVTVPSIPSPPTFTTSVNSTSGFGPTTVPDDEVQLFTALTESFQAKLDRGDIRTADEVGAELDVLRARVAAVREDPDITGNPETGWPVLQATARLISGITKAAQSALDDQPIVVDYEVDGEQSAVEVAVKLFGDPSRVQDVIDLNPGTSPDFIATGTLLVVPLE